MQHFTAWACAWVICLTLAAILAWVITSEPERPQGRHSADSRESIRLELAGQRRAAWDRDEPKPARPANTLPQCSRFGQSIPAHLLARTIIPKAPVVRGRAHLVWVLPVPVTVRVVPLWVARWEDQQQAARRRAVEAASAGQPDPGYTYPGAHSLRATA